MMRWIKNSKKGMAMLGAVAFMMVAGWQFGVSGSEALFSSTEVALEKAIEGSGMGGSKRCIVDADTGGANVDCKKSGSLCNYDTQCIP
jgi:hypothetical protein